MKAVILQVVCPERRIRRAFFPLFFPPALISSAPQALQVLPVLQSHLLEAELAEPLCDVEMSPFAFKEHTPGRGRITCIDFWAVCRKSPWSGAHESSNEALCGVKSRIHSFRKLKLLRLPDGVPEKFY